MELGIFSATLKRMRLGFNKSISLNFVPHKINIFVCFCKNHNQLMPVEKLLS